MSILKRPLTKNYHLSLKRNEPIYSNNLTLYNNFPVGLFVISKIELISYRKDTESCNQSANENEESDLKIQYINPKAAEIFELNENDNTKKIHEQLSQYKKFDKNQITEITLDNILFDPNIPNEYFGFFKNNISLIFAKFKNVNDELYIYADYYSDERKIVQNQLFQSMKFQYIATLFHELYNPINALLFMIESNQNRQNNITGSNLGKNNSDSDGNQSSELSDSDNEKLNNGNNNAKKNKNIDKLYHRKLNALNEREKDIGLLVNMIYIFLQNLILYLRINLGVDFKVDESKPYEENNNKNEKNDININNDKENFDNIYSDKYLSLIKKNKKLNLETSFCKHLDKFSYLFNFKNIHYCKDFSYLSDKYILTDESIFFDFLGQIYSFLYYIVPKSKGFELSYSLINDDKLKIIFLKNNGSKKRGYRSKKSRKSFSGIIGTDKFEAASTVKTCEMAQEILYKLSEMLGIKLKIMEYDNQKEDIYLTIILPLFKEDEYGLSLEELNKLKKLSNKDFLKDDKKSLENVNHKSDNNIQIFNEKNQLSSLSEARNRNNQSTKNINYLNPCFYQFAPERKASFLVDEVEEKNSSEEDVSSKKDENSKIKENSKKEENKLSILSKSSKNNGAISMKSYSIIISKAPSIDQKTSEIKINNTKEFSNNNLKENNSLFRNNSKDIPNPKKKNTNIKIWVNPLLLIHQKYSNIEKLRANGVEILQEKDSKADDNKKSTQYFGLESLDFNFNEDKISLNDKKSITAEMDSDTFIEIENDNDIENIININTNKNKNHYRYNKNINNISNLNNKASFNSSTNDNISQDISKNKNNVSSNRPSNKTLDYKGINDNLFVIPEINEKTTKKYKTKIQKNNISVSSCNCKDILLVDDEEFILKTSKNILKNFKLEADFAENGQECINMIKSKQEKNCKCSKSKYKLILMDITMPIMDGIEAAKNIQKLIDENKLYDTIKIIFISAHVNLDLAAIFSKIKCAVDYYAKPISRDKYKSILDKYYYSK